MAGRTVTDDIGMIEHRRCKGASNVTDTTILISKDMAGAFLGHRSHSTITMTFYAVINPAGMIEYSVSESTTGVMAHSAIGGGCRVRGSGVLRLPSGPKRNKRGAAIMAGNTIAGDTSVRKRCYRGGERISSRVAKVTILDGRQVAG